MLLILLDYITTSVRCRTLFHTTAKLYYFLLLSYFAAAQVVSEPSHAMGLDADYDLKHFPAVHPVIQCIFLYKGACLLKTNPSESLVFREYKYEPSPITRFDAAKPKSSILRRMIDWRCNVIESP